MADHNSTVRAIAWRDVFPWLIITRCFGRAIAIPILFLATTAVLVLPLGWKLAGDIFLASPQEGTDVPPTPRQLEEQFVRDANVWDWPGRAPKFKYTLPTSFTSMMQSAYNRAEAVFGRMVEGWLYYIHLPNTLSKFAFLIFGGLWTLLIWAIFGGAITRIAVVQLGREERVPLSRALRHASTRVRSYVGAPLLPILGIVFGLALLALLGMLAWSNFGVLVAGLLWPLVLLGGLVLAILLLGTCFGWPFMWVALGAEQDADAFEATSRGFTYAFQRPLRYLFYAIVAALIGAAGWLLVFHTAEILLAFCRNTVLWAAGQKRAEYLEPWFYAVPMKEDYGFLATSGGWLIRLSNGLVRSIVTGYGYSYFFCAASALYLLLRRDIDETEMDEVYGEDEDETLQLPPVSRDLGSPPPAASVSSPPPDLAPPT